MSIDLWTSIEKMVLRYSFNIDADTLIFITCGICKHIIIDARQIICGCTFCRKCIENFIKSGKRNCPNGKDKDCQNVQLNSLEDVHTERNTNTEILCLKVTCPRAGCDYEGELGNIIEHVEICCRETGRGKETDYDFLKKDNKKEIENKDIYKIDKVDVKNEIDLLKKANERLELLVSSMINEVGLYNAKISHLEKCLQSKFDSNEPFIWRLENFPKIKSEGKTVYSDCFYVSKFGYKLRLAVAPGGGDGLHLGVYFQIAKGEYDAVLRWPFLYDVTFSLLSQKEGCEDHVHTVQYPTDSRDLRSYLRPTRDYNAGFGGHCFINTDSFTSSNIYLVNGTFFIKFSVTKV